MNIEGLFPISGCVSRFVMAEHNVMLCRSIIFCLKIAV